MDFNKRVLVGTLAVGALSAAVYWNTSYETITWWDSSEYSLAAITLGVGSPPGSLLLTILGWVVSKVPTGLSAIYSLNLFAGALAAFTCGMVCFLATCLYSSAALAYNVPNRKLQVSAVASAAVASLTLAFSETTWLYAVRFTPYILTVVMTVLILWAMLKWWEAAEPGQSVRWLLVIALLFGLDFSAHRTNALLIPGLFFWVLLRRPGVFLRVKTWLAGILGLAAGLSVHLLIIPMAAARPFLNIDNPSNLSRFWDWVSLQQIGGGFLLDIRERKGDFFGDQAMDYINMFADNLFSFDGPMGLPGVIPFALGVTGLALIWRRNARLGAGLLILFTMTSAGAIIYFNVPVGFFRSMDRHYMPSLVIFAVWMAYAAGDLSARLWNLKSRYRTVVVVLAGLVLLSLPVYQVARNLRNADGTGRYFAYDTALNYLAGLPQNAILFTYGDNDTFPPWFVQQIEGFRPDVIICNQPLLNTSWYLSQLLERYADFPVDLSEEEAAQLNIIPWQDSTVVIAGANDGKAFDLPDGSDLSDSLHIDVSPSVADRFLLVQDQIVLRVLSDNQWRRPICFAGGAPQYLRPFARAEGLTHRVIPMREPPVNVDILKKNLLEEYSYRGYNDPDIPMVWTTRNQAVNLCYAFLTLIQAEYDNGNIDKARDVAEKMLMLLPPERVALQPQLEAVRDQLLEEVGVGNIDGLPLEG
jgi:hypothetical protein